MNCTREGCTKEGTHLPILTFKAMGHTHGPRGELEYKLPLCADHCSNDPNAYLTNAAWDMIKVQCTLSGKAMPDRKTLRVHFKRIPVDPPKEEKPQWP